MDLMTELDYYCPCFPTIFMPFNHFFNCLVLFCVHVRHLTREDEADAGKPHTSDFSIESATPVRCVKWQSDAAWGRALFFGNKLTESGLLASLQHGADGGLCVKTDQDVFSPAVMWTQMSLTSKQHFSACLLLLAAVAFFIFHLSLL